MPRRLQLDDLHRLVVPEEPCLSPSGAAVVYVLRTPNRDADRDERALWRVETGGGAPMRLTRGPADRAPAWSPDAAHVAFLRGHDEPAQIWLLPTAGGEPEQLTTLALGCEAPVWSPDGTSIAFTATVDEAAADAENAPVVIERLGYQADGVGLHRARRRHLHVLDVGTRRVRQLTAGDWNAASPAWSPDGTRLAFVASIGDASDVTANSSVYVIDAAAESATPDRVEPGDGVADSATWAADGQALIVVGRLTTSPGIAGLLLMRLDGGEVVDLAAPLDRNVLTADQLGALPHAAPDGHVTFCVRDRGNTHLHRVAMDGGSPRKVLGDAHRSVWATSSDGHGRTAAIVLGTAGSFGEIAVVELASGDVRVLTSHSEEALAGIELFARQEHRFEISDGTEVHGWLLRDSRRPGRQPLLVDIHGGPHYAWTGAADREWPFHQALAAQGWTVLLVNPRGSDGYGEAFFTANLGRWGEGDAADVLEPIDQLVAEGLADPARLAICGYSYGAFLTCYLTSRDDRFAAAVVGGVVSDLAAMAGSSDIGHALATEEFGGLPWEASERYAALSPYARVNDVTTPTLVVHGSADVRCPVPQAEQWFAGLRARGVPTQLVLYPDASHMFPFDGPPSHREDVNRRIVAWLQRHVAGAPGS